MHTMAWSRVSANLFLSHLRNSSPLQEREVGLKWRKRIGWQGLLLYSSGYKRLHWKCVQDIVQPRAFAINYNLFRSWRRATLLRWEVAVSIGSSSSPQHSFLLLELYADVCGSIYLNSFDQSDFYHWHWTSGNRLDLCHSRISRGNSQSLRYVFSLLLYRSSRLCWNTFLTVLLGVSIPQKTATIAMGILSAFILMYLLATIFWWTIGSGGLLASIHAVLRDASMHQDQDDKMEMLGDLALDENAAFLNPVVVANTV